MKYNTNKVILIQKYIRGFLVRKIHLIPPANYQTKEWRKNRDWYINGKSNECEKYQINLIEKIMSNKLLKTYDRINYETNNIQSIKTPMIYNNGYEFSENFDGIINKNNNKFYFNLKFICENGGAQTRSLREVYLFIKYQLAYLMKYNKTNIYFINILDGDTCFYNMNKFNYILNNKQYNKIKKYIFVGSMYDFQKSQQLNIIKII